MHFSVEKTYYGLSYAKKRKYDLLSTIYMYTMGQIIYSHYRFRAQSLTSNRKAWFRYPASLVRRFWEM